MGRPATGEWPASHPLPLAVAEAGRYPDGDLTFRGVRSTNCLLFAPRYTSPWTTLGFIALGLTPFVIAAGFVGLQAGRFALAVLLPLVMVISVANWQREYQFKSGCEWMPDCYDVFARHVADVVRSPNAAAFASLRSFLSQFMHTHTPVVPALVGGLASLGLRVPRAFLIVSFLITVLGGWALLALLERVGGNSWPAVWAVTCLGLTHFLFMKAAVRTSTDPAGYATIVIALLFAVLLCQQAEPTRLLTTAVVLATTLALFTRPTALPLSLAIGLGFTGRRLLGVLAFLVVSPTPFRSRYFLHGLPGLLIFVVPVVAALYRSHPRLTIAWFWLHVGVNLVFVALTLWKGTPVGPNHILS